MSNLCMLLPNEFVYENGNVENDCNVVSKVIINQNLFNYNNIIKNNANKKYPYPGVMPQGPATGSWPSRNQTTSNYFDPNNPIISEHIRQNDLRSLPPN